MRAASARESEVVADSARESNMLVRRLQAESLVEAGAVRGKALQSYERYPGRARQQQYHVPVRGLCGCVVTCVGLWMAPPLPTQQRGRPIETARPPHHGLAMPSNHHHRCWGDYHSIVGF